MLAKTTSADTLANAKAARASRTLAAKSKTIAANQLTGNTAGASVINTPMPATPTFQPAPVGGTPALRSYLHREAAAFEPGEGERPLNGTVRLRFMVRADGKISNLKVVGGLRTNYDNEALRMAREGPTWQPGIAAGRRADLPMELTITF
jgi:TonB family protein